MQKSINQCFAPLLYQYLFSVLYKPIQKTPKKKQTKLYLKGSKILHRVLPTRKKGKEMFKNLEDEEKKQKIKNKNQAKLKH